MLLESGRSPLPSVFIVSAGSEDLESINLLRYWRDNNDVTRINNVSYYYTHTHTIHY